MHQHEDHPHVHGPDCGCGHEHHAAIPLEGLSNLQMNFLLALHERRYLPVARFVLVQSDNAQAFAVALAPVYLGSPGDSMAHVKEVAEALDELESADYLSLDYDIPLSGYPYAEYKASDLYAYFLKTVEEGKKRADFQFDTGKLELGSMALTDRGESAVQKMMDER